MKGYISQQIVDCPDVVRSFLYHWSGMHNILWAQKDSRAEDITEG